jgi:lysophospholipid acyltransferase (LPLAT)-like uncharacterized protein
LSHPGLTYQSPNDFSLKQRIALTLGVPLIAGFYRAICMTCRQEARNAHQLENLIEAGSHAIPVFWHESLGLAAWYFRGTGYHTLTSYSFDGELAARVVRRFGLYALRGSSSRGGYDALKQLKKAAELVPAIGFTLDGPKGPRRVAKPGVAILALQTGLPVIPQAFAASRCWRMRSWDRLLVPKPFARLVTAFAEPIYPPPKATSGAIEALRSEIEGALNQLHGSLETELGQAP